MSTLPSGLPEEVGDEEILVRFAFSRSRDLWLVSPPERLKPPALYPDKRYTPLETSVFRHSGQPEEELLRLAAKNFPDREVKGAGAFKVSDLRRLSQSDPLEVKADEKAPNGPRHANIIGWKSTSDPKNQKADWKLQVGKLAGCSKIVWLLDESS